MGQHYFVGKVALGKKKRLPPLAFVHFSQKHTAYDFRKMVIDGFPMPIKHIDNAGFGRIGLLGFLSARNR